MTAVGKGECTIKVTAGETSANCAVTVYAPADDFTLSASVDTMKVGEKTSLSVSFPQYTYGTVTYEYDSKLVSIDENGEVTALAKGECEITASLGEKKQKVSIQIYALPETIELSVSSTRLAVGESVQAEIKLPEFTYMDSAEYVSENPDVAEVDENGKITALKAGDARITAKVGAAEASVDLIVMDLHLGDLRLSVGAKGQLPDKVGGESTVGATYESANEKIASVDDKGAVTAVAVGETTITITTVSGIRALVAIHVLNLPDQVKIASDTINIFWGQTIRVPYTLSRADGQDCEAACTLETSNSDRVEVRDGMKIYAKSAGVAYIRITAAGGAIALAKVVVWNFPDRMFFEYGEQTVKVGGTVKNRVGLFSGKDGFIYSETDGEGVGKFSTDNPAIATVDQAGNVTGVSAGVTNLVFTAASGMQIRASIRVLGLPTKVNLSSTEFTLGVGGQATLQATFEANETGDVKFESDHPEIASITENGVITALAKGTAVITVTAEGGATAICTVNVVAAPSKAVFEAETINLIKGTTVTIPVEFVNTDGDKCETVYHLETSSSKYAQVRGDNSIYAARTGTAYLRAVAYNGAEGYVRVKIWDKPRRLYLSNYNMTIGEGMTEKNLLMIWMSNSKNYIYSESDGERVGVFTIDDPNIATIDQAGNVTGVKKGETTMHFTTRTGLSVSAPVNVMAPPTVVKLNYSELTIGVNDTAQLTASYGDYEMGTTTYKSETPEVATVTEDGKITAVAKGTAMIVATANTGVTTTCLVTVVPAPAQVVFPTETINIFRYSTVELPVEFVNTDGDKCETTYYLTTSSKRYVSVSGNTIYGARTGTAYIRVTTYNGVEGIVRVRVWDKPKKLYIEKPDMYIGVGMTDVNRVNVWISRSKNFIYNEADGACVGKYETADPSIATVDQAGNVTGVSKGATFIRFSTTTGLSVYAKVTVLAQPTEVHLNYDKLTIGVGDAAQYSATYGSYEMGTTTYESENPKIASITADGKITAVSKGKTTIIATTNSGVKTTSEVTVVPAPAQVVFPTETINIFRYATAELPVEFINTDGDKCETTYYLTTSAKKYVSVSGNKVYGARTGTAYIRVTTYNGVEGIVRVRVWDKPKKLYIEKPDMYIGVGMTDVNRVNVWISRSKNFIYNEADGACVGKYETADPSIATVDQAGNVTGVSKGATFIRFSTTTGLSVYAKVTVLAQPTEVHLNYDKLTIGVGDAAQYSATYGSYEMGTTTYESENPKIASITADGKITAVSKGKTTIIATTNSGVKTTSEVTVVPAPAQVVFPTETINIFRYATAELPVEFINTDGDKCETTYYLTTSAKKYVSVSGNKVYGARTGTAYIRVTTYNGVEGIVRVRVWDKPKKLYLEYNPMQVGEGMTVQNRVNVWISRSKSFIYNPADGKAVGTYSIDNPLIATVDQAGNVTGVSKGQTILRFTATTGLQVATTLTVLSAPTVLTVDKEKTTLGVGMSEVLGTKIGAYEMGTIEFSSSSSEIASVDQTGKITANKPGDAIITAETRSASGGKLYATCRVTVVPAPDKIETEYSYMNVAIKGSVQMNVKYSYQGTDNCMGTVTYLTSKSSVARVDANGVITGVKAGNAIIRAVLQNGLYVDCNVTVRKAPKKVELSASSIDLGVGQEFRLYGRIYYSGGSFIYTAGDTSIAQFQNSNPDAISIAADGTITGLKPGTAYVRLYTYNGKGGGTLCRINVAPGPDWITLNEISVELSVNQSRTLYCDRSAGSMTAFEYTSSNPDVVRVVANGSSCTLYAVGSGTAKITASSSNGKSAECEVRVYALPESASFESASVQMGAGETKALPKVIISSSKGECAKGVTYTSSNASVAKVNADGNVTGVAPGNAAIYATTYNGVTATCAITVYPAPKSIQVSADKTRLAVGETANVTAKVDTIGGYTLSAEDSSVLEIKGNTVTARKVGKTNVIAKSYNGVIGKLEIEVLPTAGSVALNPGRITLGTGMTAELKTTIPNNTLATISFESMDETVAKVDANGKVTAIGKGTARIFARVEGMDAAYDTCEVTVKPMPETIELTESEINLFIGESKKLNAKALSGADANCYGAITFASNDASVAEVRADGTITAIGAGETKIVARSTANANVFAECTVKVTEAKVWLNERAVTLGVGESFVNAIHTANVAESMNVVSSAPEVAAMDVTGKITAKQIGETTITVTCGEDSAQCVVTVKAAPTGVELSETALTLYAGETAALTARATGENAAGRIQYASKDENVVRVDENGEITAVGAGETEIVAKTYVEGVEAICRVSVVNAPEKIRFAEMDELILSKGDTYRLAQPVITSSLGKCDTRYTLAISRSGIATIAEKNGSYDITAANVGSAVLRVKTLNGKSASLKLTVVEAPTAIEFDPDTIRLGMGETYEPQILGNNGSVIAATFSSDSSCVTVENGKLVANAKGKATITARSIYFDNLKTSIEIEVVDLAKEFTLGDAEYRMGVGENFELTTVTSENTAVAALEYESDDESVARVDRTGVVYAIGVGEATVTAKAQNGATATKKIIVSKMATKVELLPQEISACLQDTVQLSVRFGSDQEYANLYFDSADDSIATVDQNGLVRFHALGTTTISAEAYNGLSDTIEVHVEKTPTAISFAQSKALILLGDRAQLKPVFDQGACYFTLESSNPEIISIGADGYLEANQKGTAKITLKTNVVGLKAEIDVEVVDKLEGIVVELGKDTLELHETTQVIYSLRPTNLLGTGKVRFESSNTQVATVDASGVVTGVAYGEAEIRVIAGDGTVGKAKVNVLGGKRRAFVAYYYGEPTDHGGHLTFSANDAYSFADALKAATVEGRAYDICGPISNAPKSTLFSRIDEHFRDTTDDDTSVLYFCSHGGARDEYYFGIPNNYDSENDDEYRIYASELYNHIVKIKGKVVVVMVSCGAGGLIDALREKLGSENGRISILASSHSDSSSSFYSVSDRTNCVDYYTFALLHGLGYSASQDLAGMPHGWMSFVAPADANNDGSVTVGELFDYAKRLTMYLVQNKVGGKGYYGTVRQTPQSYISDLLRDLILFKR